MKNYVNTFIKKMHNLKITKNTKKFALIYLKKVKL